MAEAKIVRTQIIVVGEVGTNSFGDLTFTDREGRSYKIAVKRKQYFEKTIIQDTAVQLNYAMSSFGKEYIYSATAVTDKVEVVEPTHLKHDGSLGVRRDTEETKLRSMAISYAKDLATAKVIELKEIRTYADKFLAYILNEESVLVKEAKKLGGKIIEEGEEP